MSNMDEEDDTDETSNWNESVANEGNGEFEYDLYNLTSFNYHPIEIDESHKDFEDNLYKLSCHAAQDLVNKLFQCPIQKADVGPVAQLPSEKTRLPREKVVPEPKQLTKWEKFAKTKGIQKTKKERMVYDDVSGEYKPRYGYKGINSGLDEIPVVEVKPGQDPYADPWAEDKKQRKEKVTKNLTNKLKNDLKRNGKGSGSTLTSSPASAAGKYSKNNRKNSLNGSEATSTTKNIPVDLDDNKKKRGKEGLRNALEISQISTASMGRYDELRKNEPEKKLKGKKRSYRDNFINDKDEKQIMKSQLRIVDDKLDKKKRGVTNSLKAYEGIIPDAPSDQFKSKKGKSSAASASPSSSKSKSPKKSSKAAPAAKKRKMK